MKKHLFVAVALLLAGSASAGQRTTQIASGTEAAATRAVIAGVPWSGEPGIRRSIEEIQAVDRAMGPITKGVLVDIEEREREEPDRSGLPQNPNSPYVSSWPPTANVTAAANEPTGAPFTIGTSFLGANIDSAGLIPPDSMGAVGPTQVLVVVNGRIRVFDKNGALGPLNATTNAFFDSVRGGRFTSDPRARFDRLTSRWFVTMITVAAPNRVLVAVSDGPQITSGSSFTFFQFGQDLVGPTPNADTGALADYATLGIDNNALYIGANMFSTNAYLGSSVFVVRKSSILGAGPIVVTAFRDLADSRREGIDTPQGVSNDDPAAAEGYFIGVDTLRFGLLNVRRVTDPGGIPILSDDIEVTIPATSLPRPIRPFGSGQPLDASNDRLFAAQIHKNQITGRRTLWTAHAIQVDSTGVASTSGGRTGSRWYEVGDLASTPRLLQAGTLYDPNPGDAPRSYLFPSIAMSGQGHALLAATTAGPQQRAGIALAMRLATDALGSLRSSQIVQDGAATYNVQTSGTQRWGDYSYTCVDPSDGMTMWTFQEYCDATNSWAVRVVELKPPPPPPIDVTTPQAVGIGRTTTVTMVGLASDGSGYFDNDSSYQSRLRASVSGTGVAVVGVEVPDLAHVKLTLSVSADAAPGPRAVTITNPDGQSVVAADAIVLGASLDSAQVKKNRAGKFQLLLAGSGFSGSVAVFVDGVGFVKPAQFTSSLEILQRGKLTNGKSINKAIRRGQTVVISLQGASGTLATLQYTRP